MYSSVPIALLLAIHAIAADIVVKHDAAIVLDQSEPPPVRKAVADLASDFQKVFGRAAPTGTRPGARIVVALNHNLPPGIERPYAPESFRIVAKAPDTIVLTGADARGCIYAVYEFSRRFLGVDPLYFWTDHEPPRHAQIRIPANTDIASGPPSFRYRGWFINDEDLLTGWKPGKAHGTGIALEVWDRIFEALLRLKGNMIVPGTFIFPDEPQVRAAANRGLIVTQHHIEVLGTNTYRWPEDQPYSFTAHPALLLNAWRNSADSYLPFQEVLWTLGYRGRHDRAFWEDDASAGTTELDHARVIRQAIDAQIAIVRERRRDPYFIMNAWMEAVPLIRKGYLQIPDGVTLVWPDNGHGVIRDGGAISKGQGVYYHTAMHDFMANQLTEMVPLARIDRELGRAVKAGATEYLLVNTSDVRPVPMTTRAVMELAWNGRSDPDFIERWSGEEFGPDAAKAVAEYYRAFFDAPGRFGKGETETFGDSAYQTIARAILTNLITGKDTAKVDVPLMTKAAADAEPRWAHARKLAEAVSRSVPAARKEFYQSHVLTQLDVHEYSNRMLKHLAEGRLKDAQDDLDRVLESFRASEYGKWAGFYSQELFTNVRLSRAMIQAALDQKNGKPPPADLPIQSSTPDPYPILKAYQGSRHVNTGIAPSGAPQHTLYLSGSITKDYVVGAKLPPSGLFALTPGGWQHRGYNMPFLYGIDAADPATLLLAAGNGLIRASDGGERWTLLTGSDLTELRDVAVDRHAKGTIYIAHSAGIRVTHDGGATWREIGAGLHRKYTEAIRVDPRRSNVLVAGGEEGLFRTEDEGSTWRLAGAAGYQVLRIEVSPHDPCCWMAATQRGGLFASTDCGRTFESASAFGFGRNIYAIAFDQAKPGRIAVAAWGPGVGVSEDNGKTWQIRNAGLPTTEVTAVAFDPDHPGRLYAALREQALYVSDDAGMTWKKEGFDGAYITFLKFLPTPRDSSRPVGRASGPAAWTPAPAGRPYEPPAITAASSTSEFNARVHTVIDAFAHPGGPGPFGYPTIAARLHLHEDAKWCSERLEEMLAAGPTGDMFWMYPVTAIAYLDRGQLTPSARTALRKAWRTYMPYRGDTENHFLLYYASLYLMAQLYPDDGPDTWYTGKSSLANLEEAREWIESWMRLTTRRGQGEYDSPHYMTFFVTPVSYLAAWAKDPEMRQRASMMLDYLIADYAAENLGGTYVGAQSRVYDAQLFDKSSNLANEFGWLWFGFPQRSTGASLWYVLSSAYEPPDILKRIATDRTQPYTHYERKRTRNRWRFNDELHGPVYKTTYVRREYAVSSDQGGILQPIQQHSWDVTWSAPDQRGVHNTFFTLHPYSSLRELQTYFVFSQDTGIEDVVRSKKMYDSPGKFSGGSPYEKIVQDRDTLVALYDIPTETRFPQINGFFSKDLAEIREDASGWIFMRGGDALIACRPLQPYTWKPIQTGGKRLFSPYLKNGVVVQVAAASEYPGLDAFRRAILALPITFTLNPSPSAHFRSLRGTQIDFTYGETPTLDGHPIDYEHWPLFGGPFLESAVDSEKLTIKYGNERCILDFKTLKISTEPLEPSSKPLKPTTEPRP